MATCCVFPDPVSVLLLRTCAKCREVQGCFSHTAKGSAGGSLHDAIGVGAELVRVLGGFAAGSARPRASEARARAAE